MKIIPSSDGKQGTNCGSVTLVDSKLKISFIRDPTIFKLLIFFFLIVFSLGYLFCILPFFLFCGKKCSEVPSITARSQRCLPTSDFGLKGVCEN